MGENIKLLVFQGYTGGMCTPNVCEYVPAMHLHEFGCNTGREGNVPWHRRRHVRRGGTGRCRIGRAELRGAGPGPPRTPPCPRRIGTSRRRRPAAPAQPWPCAAGTPASRWGNSMSIHIPQGHRNKKKFALNNHFIILQITSAYVQ
jgi:hypothetical protein